MPCAAGSAPVVGPPRLPAESRDAIPFGLKRRVPIGIPILHDEERRRAEALAEIDRAKTEFFTNVSHEFRVATSHFELEERGYHALVHIPDLACRIRRAIAQVALDLIAEVMEIDADFRNAAGREGELPLFFSMRATKTT